MDWLNLLAYLFGGAFLGNGVPHFVSGVTGRAFQTPFATPHGVGLSSSTVNFLWGFANFVAAYLLIAHVGAFDLRIWSDAAAVAAGVFAAGLFAARHFGRFHGGRQTGDD